ncbi:MAG: ABC transporter permease [Lentisphaeria bacterium]|nr:ABC transporter permease [Lentisphaeria bacterium]
MFFFLRMLQVTFLNLSCHAFRAFLAALGVVLGVGAVVAMMAISEGARRESIDRIRAMGIDNIVVRSVKPRAGEGGGEDMQGGTVDYGLKKSDLAHLEKTFHNVKKLVPVRDFQQKIYDAHGRLTDVRMVGTTPDFLGVTFSRQVDKRGRWLTDVDAENKTAVCVVGVEAARKLFGIEDPLDQSVAAGGFTFRVVGLLDNPRGGRLAGVYDLRNIVYVPLSAADSLYGKSITQRTSRTSMERFSIEYDYVYVKVIDVDQLANTVARLRGFLNTTHEVTDYEIQVPYELLLAEEATQRVFKIVMGSIAAISLLVGGIGIMNIMLANIFERTREIGTRRALGAKKHDILLQFLLESTVLTGLGGAAGLALGLLIAHAVQYFAEMRTDVTMLSVGVSLGVSICTGMLFGTYPAWKAANLDPIEALRHE